MSENTNIPEIGGRLRKNILRLPEAIHQASGIVINGRRIRSFVFTTDLAIIRNCDADAVFAIYPFTPQQAISDAIIKASYIPVFCGVGGVTYSVSCQRCGITGSYGCGTECTDFRFESACSFQGSGYSGDCHSDKRRYRYSCKTGSRSVCFEYCLRTSNL